MYFVAETSNRKFLLFLARPGPTYLTPVLPTLRYPLRYSITLIVLLLLLLLFAWIYISTKKRSSSMTDERYPLRRVEGLLARSLPTRVRKHARSRSGERRVRMARWGRGGRGEENDIYYRPLCHEYHCGVG